MEEDWPYWAASRLDASTGCWYGRCSELPFSEELYGYVGVEEIDGVPVDDRTRLTSRPPSSLQRSTLRTNMEKSISLEIKGQ